MSDDLVKRLREAFVDLDDLNDAADRIEELESKLAKAVEALKRIASNEFAGVMLTSIPPQDAAAHFARLTLTELSSVSCANTTGGKDE